MPRIHALILALLLLLPTAVLAAEVNINTADATALEALEGVGPAKAEAIIEYRDANGPFASVDDLTNVNGIGPATLDANRDQLSVE